MITKSQQFAKHSPALSIGNMGSDSGDKLQMIHSFLLSSIFPVLAGDFASLLVKREPFERKREPDHVFTDSFCPLLRLSSDLAVDVETCVASEEDLLDNGKADELFPKKQHSLL
ncbi:MAG: hypothetical protein OEW23_19350 [Candidatus Aminicenantes bacterium]|nr:hypothetical protein [Candidatus Aminicenantes bacterium]MDH5466642.1 hypothetical protein [Candidatus Aminicenantes bacterium]